MLGNVSNAYFPDVLKQLGVDAEQIKIFSRDLAETGHVLKEEGKKIVSDILLTRVRKHVEVNLLEGSDIREVILELKEIQEEFEEELRSSDIADAKKKTAANPATTRDRR